MGQALLSIIVPTKNEERIIEDCLRSLKGQRTEFPYEIIIIDGGSTDRTVELARGYGARILVEERPGKSLARQIAAEQAEGEMLCFTEADCVVPETWIETIGRAFQSDPDTMAVTGGYTLIDSTWFYAALVRAFLPVSVWAFRVLYGHHSFRATNFAIRAQALREAGGFNTTTMELDDVELSMRASRHGKIRFLPAMSVRTRDRRFRNRLGSYLTEFVRSYYEVGIRRRPVRRALYKDIR